MQNFFINRPFQARHVKTNFGIFISQFNLRLSFLFLPKNLYLVLLKHYQNTNIFLQGHEELFLKRLQLVIPPGL